MTLRGLILHFLMLSRPFLNVHPTARTPHFRTVKPHSSCLSGFYREKIAIHKKGSPQIFPTRADSCYNLTRIPRRRAGASLEPWIARARCYDAHFDKEFGSQASGPSE